MTTETKRDLTADLALCEAATAGPWSGHTNRHPELGGQPWGWLSAKGGAQIGTWSGSRNRNYNEDNRFITEAREGWPHAIRRAIAAEAELDAEEQRRVFFEDVADGLSYENAQIRASIDKLRQAYERGDSDEALAIAVSAFLREVSEDAAA